MKKQAATRFSVTPKLFYLFFVCSSLTFAFAERAHAQADGDDVFKPANIKAAMLKVTDWQLKNPKHTPTDWTNGAFYAGVVAAWQTTKSPVILDSLMALGQR